MFLDVYIVTTDIARTATNPTIKSQLINLIQCSLFFSMHPSLLHENTPITYNLTLFYDVCMRKCLYLFRCLILNWYSFSIYYVFIYLVYVCVCYTCFVTISVWYTYTSMSTTSEETRDHYYMSFSIRFHFSFLDTVVTERDGYWLVSVVPGICMSTFSEFGLRSFTSMPKFLLHRY